MAEFNFPTSPNNGDTYDLNGVLYTYDSAKDYWYATNYENSPIGYTGSRGVIGYTGSLGYTGSIGYTGSRGVIGYTGSLGGIPVVAYRSESGVSITTGTGTKGITGIGTDTGFGGDANNFDVGSYVKISSLAIPTTYIIGTISGINAGSIVIEVDYSSLTSTVSTTWTITYVGFTGDRGYTGSQGIQGDTGYTGSQGNIGYSGSQGALLPWSIKTSNYTMVDGDRIIADTSGGSFNLTLPASPSTGEYFQITDGADMSVNNVTILRNGSTIEDTADDVLLTIPQATYEFIYDGSTWQVTVTAGPKGDIGYTGSKGFDSIPQNSQTGAYTLQLSDISKHVSADGTITVPADVFSVGDPITIYNSSTSGISIVEDTGVTMYLVGTDTTGTRSLDQKGLATVLCVANNTFVITGGGLS